MVPPSHHPVYMYEVHSCKAVYCNTYPRNNKVPSHEDPMEHAQSPKIRLPAAELDCESDGEPGELEEMQEPEFVGGDDAAVREMR